MINFKSIELEDKEWVEKYLRESDFRGCEYSFSTMMLWKNIYLTEVADYENTLCYRCHFVNDMRYVYAFPAGNGDKKAAIDMMLEESHNKGQKLVFRGFEEDIIPWIEENYPGKFDITTTQGEWDYVYLKDDLEKLAGSKYHGKRNHIARFKDGGDWHYEPLTLSNRKACWKMSEEWYEIQKNIGNKGVLREQAVLKYALENMEALGLTGGVLYREDEVVAFTIGEPFNEDTYHVHIEKAFSDIQGAYPMINQQYVQNAMQGYKYVNREEDDGVAGLRKAKESYNPVMMIKKYTAVEK